MAIPGLRTESCIVSLRFFSPPLISTLSGRSSNFESSPILAASASSNGMAATAESSLATLDANTSATRTPGTSIGYCIAKKRPAWARCHVSIVKMSWPSSMTDPPVTSYPGLPIKTCDRVDFPDPFGPIMAWTSPDETVRLIPFRISVPPALAVSSEISSVCFLVMRVQP